ncbi:MAG: hypothetical protein L0287_32705 [Anaerolineae bacterium]|nr:hypothetical protein [Anaerolineae bacterium]
MLKAIENYPYLQQCFSGYIKWLFENCDESRRKYDVVFVKITTGRGTLGELERIFQEFGSILDMDEGDFCKAFRFDVDRNKKEILKIGDLLAEPWAAIALSKYGFNTIRKTPLNKSKMCDFTANYKAKRFAVEIKNLRSKEVEDYYIWQTDALYNKQDVFLSSFYPNSQGQLHERESESMLSRFTHLLENKEKSDKTSEQLENAKRELACQATMLIGYLDLITILSAFPEIIMANLETIGSQFGVSDYLACCVNETLICSPQLS